MRLRRRLRLSVGLLKAGISSQEAFRDMEWLRLATRRSVIRRASAVAVVVGTVLVAINHGDALLRGEVSPGRALRIILTVFVPYCVSTYSGVGAMREHHREKNRN